METFDDDDDNVGKTIKLITEDKMWNKADIRAVLLLCEMSIAPFPSRLQNVVNIPRLNVDIFV